MFLTSQPLSVILNPSFIRFLKIGEIISKNKQDARYLLSGRSDWWIAGYKRQITRFTNSLRWFNKFIHLKFLGFNFFHSTIQSLLTNGRMFSIYFIDYRYEGNIIRYNICMGLLRICARFRNKQANFPKFFNWYLFLIISTSSRFQGLRIVMINQLINIWKRLNESTIYKKVDKGEALRKQRLTKVFKVRQ